MRKRQVLVAMSCAVTLCLAAVVAAEEPSAADAARADIKATLGFVPGFLAKLPDVALPGAWGEMKSIQMNPNTSLSGKQKELIGLAVAAQIPCEYCVYAHTQFCSLNGATDEEIAEAVVMSGLTRHWSAVIAGNQTQMAKFKAEIGKLVEAAKKAAAAGEQAPSGPPATVTDAKGATDQIRQMFGSVPEFFTQFPAQGLAAAWTLDRDVEMNPATALSGKDKALIGVAVASQTPCKFCTYADTEFAKLEGATDQEVREAIAMAGITRFFSTWLNGTQTDKAAFRRDVDKLVRNAKRAMQQAAAAEKKAEKTVAAKH